MVEVLSEYPGAFSHPHEGIHPVAILKFSTYTTLPEGEKFLTYGQLPIIRQNDLLYIGEFRVVKQDAQP